MKPEQDRMKALLAESVTMLCKNGLSFQDEMRIEAVIGITLDNKDVLLVHINEKYGPEDVDKTDEEPPLVIDEKTTKESPRKRHKPTVHQEVEAPSPKASARLSVSPSNKLPTKRPATRRGRKQKLTNLTNGQTKENSPAQNVSEINKEHIIVDADGNSLPIRQPHIIKPDPYNQYNQNGLDGKYRTERSPSKSDDDTLAMQQGYSKLKDSSIQENRERTGPSRKRQMLNMHGMDNHENEIQLVTPYVKAASGHSDDSQGIAALSPPWPNPSTPDESMNMAVDHNSSPGCSSWSPVSTSTQQKSRSQRPSNGLQSTAVKRMLSEYLVEPIAQTDCKVCTFRLMWHGNQDELERIWTRLVHYQEEIDRIITEPAQVALAVSAVTATSTRPKSGSGKQSNGTENVERGKTFPGLAYWIVLQNEDDFSENDLYSRIYENSYGARLKSLSEKPVASDLQEMCSTLYLVVKDNVDGYVRWKMDSSLASIGEADHDYKPVVKVYARAEQDFKTLLMAKEALAKSRFQFSLLKTDA